LQLEDSGQGVIHTLAKTKLLRVPTETVYAAVHRAARRGHDASLDGDGGTMGYLFLAAAERRNRLGPWEDERYSLAAIPLVDAKVRCVHRDHRMPWIQFAHADQA
jgi:hypothetical protein